MSDQKDIDRFGDEDWRSWVMVIGLCVVIILWGLLSYLLVKDRPRAWDFGALPVTPAESIYSTVEPAPSGQTVPRQVPMLPGAASNAPPATQGSGE